MGSWPQTGYAGFDPLGFSDYYDLKWLQEAEIKHGRVCMLAAVRLRHTPLKLIRIYAAERSLLQGVLTVV
jgi:hypothetical protein